MRKNEIEKHQEDPGGDTTSAFHVLLSIAASLAVAIIAIAVGSRILEVETTSAGTYLATTVNVTMSLVLVILWGMSLVYIIRYVKSLSGKDQAQIAIIED